MGGVPPSSSPPASSAGAAARTAAAASGRRGVACVRRAMDKDEKVRVCTWVDGGVGGAGVARDRRRGWSRGRGVAQRHLMAFHSGREGGSSHTLTPSPRPPPAPPLPVLSRGTLCNAARCAYYRRD